MVVRRPDSRSGDANQDHQGHFAAGETVAPALAAPDEHFDKANQAPGNQQEGPILGDQIEYGRFGVQIPPQKQSAHQQQQQGAGQRMASHAVPPPGGLPPASAGGAAARWFRSRP